MDVDKIHPFSSTLGWHSLKIKGEVQTRKGLRWIPRYPETKKGVVSDEMLRGVENKHRSGDSRIGDDGSLWFWDWKSGHSFQQSQSTVQPGSLDSEAGIYALSYDIIGSRLVTYEADKTIKMQKEDENVTPETHPVDSNPPIWF